MGKAGDPRLAVGTINTSPDLRPHSASLLIAGPVASWCPQAAGEAFQKFVRVGINFRLASCPSAVWIERPYAPVHLARMRRLRRVAGLQNRFPNDATIVSGAAAAPVDIRKAPSARRRAAGINLVFRAGSSNRNGRAGRDRSAVPLAFQVA